MIKLLVMDVDGTLTDGKIYMGNEGEVFKVFDIKDGCGIHDLLKPNGIEPIIITGRRSKILENRAKEIGINSLFQGVSDKVLKLNEILSERNLELSDVAYIGDDINDLTCMEKIICAGGLTACPYDAVEAVRSVVNYICKCKGGEGAVRDFIEWVLKSNDKMQLSKNVDLAIKQVKKFDLESLSVGRYELTDGSYFMVEEYITKKEYPCRLQSHKKYIEVQWILQGQEMIKIYDIDKLIPEISYDLDKDIAFWKSVDNMTQILLSSGSYVVLYPNYAYTSSIMVKEQSAVRKIVIKVKI